MRGKGEGALFKDARGLWTARVELPPDPELLDKHGKPKRRQKVIRSKDKATVMRELAQKRRELERVGDLPTASQTLESWMLYWLDKVAAKKLRPNVLATYRSLTSVHIIPVLGKVRLDKLTPAHVVRLRDAMLDKGLSSTYALNAYRVLSKALEDAMREGRIPRNPAKLTDAPRKARTNLNALTVDEAVELVRRVVPALEAVPYDPAPARWATYVLTGSRRGELIGLELDRVTDSLDLSWQLQRIKDISTAPADYEYRNLRGKLYLVRPKSRSGWRIIPLVEPLKTLLAAHIERAPKNRYGLVFTNMRGEPIDPSIESRAWAAYAPTLTDEHVRLHDVRHTTADLLYEAGVPEELIIEILGHSTRAMSRAYKSRGNQRRLTDAMEQVSKLLELG